MTSVKLKALQNSPASEADAELLFPFIDVIGQYKHRDWPGKVHSPAALTERWTTEAIEPAAQWRLRATEKPTASRLLALLLAPAWALGSGKLAVHATIRIRAQPTVPDHARKQ